MNYWVYTNWTVKHARVHTANCTYCNNGRGIHDTDNENNGKWFGPYNSYQDARTKALELITEYNCEDQQIDCDYCNPSA